MSRGCKGNPPWGASAALRAASGRPGADQQPFTDAVPSSQILKALLDVTRYRLNQQSLFSALYVLDFLGSLFPLSMLLQVCPFFSELLFPGGAFSNARLTTNSL